MKLYNDKQISIESNDWWHLESRMFAMKIHIDAKEYNFRNLI